MAFAGKLSKEEIVEKVILENYDRYYRLAYSYVHNEADACDIVQNGAYKAILKCQDLKQKEYAATWVYRIMLNEIFSSFRGRDLVSLEETEYEEGIEDAYRDFDLEAVMDTLSGKDKAVVELRYFEELKLEEIADILHENVNTVKSRLYRALRKLRIELEEMDYERAVQA